LNLKPKGPPPSRCSVAVLPPLVCPTHASNAPRAANWDKTQKLNPVS
jgi:hypothetical protein